MVDLLLLSTWFHICLPNWDHCFQRSCWRIPKIECWSRCMFMWFSLQPFGLGQHSSQRRWIRRYEGMFFAIFAVDLKFHFRFQLFLTSAKTLPAILVFLKKNLVYHTAVYSSVIPKVLFVTLLSMIFQLVAVLMKLSVFSRLCNTLKNMVTFAQLIGKKTNLQSTLNHLKNTSEKLTNNLVFVKSMIMNPVFRPLAFKKLL